MAAENKIETAFVKHVKKLGGEVRKLKWIGRHGAPDRIVFFPPNVVFFVELKAPGKKLDPHQKREHKRLKRFGMKVYTIDSIADAVMTANLEHRAFF